ncbi:hypothetical protein Q3G72_016649 [Acer saccharum]|nr:hypothetical protein Q3G72_016649 [Acer saccharum]
MYLEMLIWCSMALQNWLLVRDVINIGLRRSLLLLVPLFWMMPSFHKHGLAKLAISSGCDQYWLEDVPSATGPIVLDDAKLP